MDSALRQVVGLRAGNRCEYCHLRQDHAPFAQFHIEHIIPKKHGGGNDPMNLALACAHCNLRKGSNLSGLDPQTGQMTALFSPRKETWSDHFAFDGPVVVGLTPTGRATVRVLAMNAAGRLQLRAELRALGRSF